jgi:hypothetical protein
VLRVDGHTDVRPITDVFKSNWDLSAARAIAVVQYLIGKGVSPQRLVAAGFGEFQPIDVGQNRGFLQAQPPHRVQADRAVSCFKSTPTKWSGCYVAVTFRAEWHCEGGHRGRSQ